MLGPSPTPTPKKKMGLTKSHPNIIQPPPTPGSQRASETTETRERRNWSERAPGTSPLHPSLTQIWSASPPPGLGKIFEAWLPAPWAPLSGFCQLLFPPPSLMLPQASSQKS